MYLIINFILRYFIKFASAHVYVRYRFLASLIALVLNSAQPEGSVAEGYIAQECVTFYLRYFEGVETVFDRPERNNDGHPSEDFNLFVTAGQSKGQVQMVELYELSRKQTH